MTWLMQNTLQNPSSERLTYSPMDKHPSVNTNAQYTSGNGAKQNFTHGTPVTHVVACPTAFSLRAGVCHRALYCPGPAARRRCLVLAHIYHTRVHTFEHRRRRRLPAMQRPPDPDRVR
jgi:hypothetical protein